MATVSSGVTSPRDAKSAATWQKMRKRHRGHVGSADFYIRYSFDIMMWLWETRVDGSAPLNAGRRYLLNVQLSFHHYRALRKDGNKEQLLQVWGRNSHTVALISMQTTLSARVHLRRVETRIPKHWVTRSAANDCFALFFPFSFYHQAEHRSLLEIPENTMLMTTFLWNWISVSDSLFL